MPGAMVGLPVFQFQVAFTGLKSGLTVAMQPNDPTITPTWTDLTHRLTVATTKRGKQYELDSVQASEHTFTLRNIDGALDPQNTASPYYPYVNPNLPYRLSVIYGGTTYRISTGVIQSWPRAWTLHGYLDWVTPTGTDALGALSQMSMVSVYNSTILAENYLLGYWPLDEASGASTGANNALTSAGLAVPSTWGTGGGIAFGTTTLTGLIGAGATAGVANSGITTGLTSSGNGSGAGQAVAQLYDAAAIVGGASLGSGVRGYTLECWVQGPIAWAADFLCVVPSNGGKFPIKIGVDSSGNVHAADDYGAFLGTTTSLINGLHHVVFSVNTASPMGTLYVDGASVATSTSVGQNIINIGTQGSIKFGMVSGTTAQVAIYNEALSGTQVSNHYNAGNTAFPEATGARFTHILGWSGYTGPAVGPFGGSVPAGDSNVTGAVDIAGISALQLLADLAITEGGNVFCDNSGNVVFENRHCRLTQTSPVWIFGENVAGGELPYLDDAGVDFDMMQVYNQLDIARAGGAAFFLQDFASMQANYPRRFPSNPLTVPLDTDDNTLNLGQFYMYAHKTPRPRLQKVSFSPAKNPSLTTFAATVQVGHRVRFNRRVRGSTNPNPFTLDLFVESVAHKIDASTGDWTVTLECTPNAIDSAAGWGMVTAARGTLNAGTAGAATTFVVNVGIDASGNTPTQNGWTSSGITGINITDGANSETLTVATMTVASGLVTVTTTSGAAHAHTAGVEVWEADGTATTFNQYDTSAVVDQMTVAH